MSKVMKTSLDFSLTVKTEEKDNKNEIITTIEELEGYAIIKAILAETCDINRIVYRDNATYFNIILDDNILKTICRLYLNKSNKYIAFLVQKDGEKRSAEDRILINSVNDIFMYKDKIIQRVEELEANYVKK